MNSRPAHDETVGYRLFAGLARGIIRHPWYPVIFWVALLVVVVPFLPLLGSVTTNSSQTVPSSAPSSIANAEFARLFPNEAGGSASILLFTGPNLTSRPAQDAIQNVTRALLADRSLQDVASVSSVYTSYASYLAGQAEIAAGAIRGADAGADGLTTAINGSAALLWGTPSLFVSNWEAAIANTSEPPSFWNPQVLAETDAELGNNSPAIAVLSAFYAGAGGSGAGFNGSAACAADPAQVVACSEALVHSQVAPLVPTLFPTPSAQGLADAVLAHLAIGNSTDWPDVRATASSLLGPEIGQPVGWVETVWTEFPGTAPSATSALAWANATEANVTLWTEPLPVPYALLSQFVNPAGTASIVSVGYTVSDAYTNASGGQPVFADYPKIDARAASVLAASDPSRSISYVQTGGGPLDLFTQTAVNSTLALVLPLTVGLLLLIAMLYFRSPITPLVTFAGLGIALVLALGGTILIGKLVGAVDTTSLTLEEVFVLGVGTDYSIFLVARYREERVHGSSPDEAIVNSVAWAGQSVATSGSTAIIATLALTFSGVALLAQWGSVLSLAILITILMSLTLVPAFLKILGGRIFWPTSGARFERHARRSADGVRKETTYFYRVGRLTQRRPVLVVVVLLLVSLPLVYLALNVPLAYDFYGQLPAGHPATDGLQSLYTHYGDGFATPSFALVTFSSPLVVGNHSNATEFADVAALTSRAENTSGIASVASPIGPDGAPLSEWVNLSSLALAPQENLLGTLPGFVGTDGRTVVLTLVPTSTGLSSEAVNSVRAVESTFAGFTSSHPEVTAIAYGGGAPTIGDLADETAHATLILLIAVTVGLLLVLVAVLRTWIIAVMAIATIGLSISWAWAITYLVFQELLGFPLFFYVRTILFLLILGLGIDYNIFVLSRVREERLRGRTSSEAVVTAVGRTGGIITAAAIILASAFGALMIGEFTLIRAIGFSVAVAVVLDAMVVRTYLVPAFLQLLGDRAWSMTGRRRPTESLPGPTEPVEGPSPAVGDATP
ncbi:MAG TPA: MMPL family transporter [Thermoplasmata archaeon]|nr:MMPL family transporter [Thermoplasmata archaeon]